LKIHSQYTKGGASAVCEVMDKEIAVEQEKFICKAIETLVELDKSKDFIVSNLVNKYGLTESEAIAKYDMYAPVVK